MKKGLTSLTFAVSNAVTDYDLEQYKRYEVSETQFILEWGAGAWGIFNTIPCVGACGGVSNSHHHLYLHPNKSIFIDPVKMLKFLEEVLKELE